MSITRTYVRDTRNAEGDVTDMPPLCTAKGNRPISPRRIRVSYDIASGRVWGIEILGRKLFEERSSGRGRINDTTTRRFDSADLESAPQWVQNFVAAHRP